MRNHSNRHVPSGALKIAKRKIAVLAPAMGALLFSMAAAEAKTPGKSYCFYGKCHRVKTIAETKALIGKDETLVASHYDSCKRDRYNPCGLTSSGEVFRHDQPDNAASPTYPDGTTLLVWAPDTGASVVLRINNAGPYWGNRKLDVSIKAAEVLGFKGKGVATLKARVISAPTQKEATYSRNRTYPKVPGYVGQFASLDEAQAGAATAYLVAGLESPFAPTELGANNPTRVAGLSGTQSGAAPVVPSALLASAKPASQTPVTVASLAVPVAAEPAASKPVAVEATPPRADRAVQRNSRAYRVAARKQNQQRVARRHQQAPVATVAVIPDLPKKRYATQDGTNDMSMFTRHTYAGMKRLAPQERQARLASLGNGG